MWILSVILLAMGKNVRIARCRRMPIGYVLIRFLDNDFLVWEIAHQGPVVSHVGCGNKILSKSENAEGCKKTKED